MAYVPHEWESGEVITADLLNHLENGVGGNNEVTSGGSEEYIIFTKDGSTYRCNKTFSQIQALIQGQVPFKAFFKSSDTNYTGLYLDGITLNNYASFSWYPNVTGYDTYVKLSYWNYQITKNNAVSANYINYNLSIATDGVALLSSTNDIGY